MKRIVSLFLLFSSIAFSAYSQCPVCTPDVNCSFDSLICASNRSPACVGVAYSQVLTIAVPASFTDPSSGTAYAIQKVKTSITGFPAGISSLCNPSSCTINGGSRGCISICGTSNAAGTYPTLTTTTVTIIIAGVCPFCITTTIDTALAGTFVVQAKDCYGVCGGTATVDNCGICSGGTTGKLPNCSDGIQCTLDACSNGQCTTHTDTCCVQQGISLASGWNTISGYVIPSSPSMPTVFQAIVSNIILVKNNTGQTYIPSLGINNIGNWNYLQGYKVKTNAVSTLNLSCTKANPSTPISLNLGWNIIPYLRTTSMSVPTALSSLGSSVILMKNNAGQTYIPSLGINTIGNMLPGQGYQIKMSAAGSLVYPP